MKLSTMLVAGVFSLAGATAMADDQSCATVKMADPGWSDIAATNAITGCVQEGIGDQGIYLIDWIADEDDEIHQELRRIRNDSVP